jgi:hypothetical protein
MHRGRINQRYIIKISGLAIIASVGAYSWTHQHTRIQQDRIQPPSEKKNNPGTMAVMTPFQVRCLTKAPLLFHTPFGACLSSLGATKPNKKSLGLMKPETTRRSSPCP